MKNIAIVSDSSIRSRLICNLHKGKCSKCELVGAYSTALGFARKKGAHAEISSHGIAKKSRIPPAEFDVANGKSPNSFGGLRVPHIAARRNLFHAANLAISDGF
jgi:hypothetical protein